MNNIIYYNQILDSYDNKISKHNTFLSEKEDRQFRLLHKWWLKDNFTETQLKQFNET